MWTHLLLELLCYLNGHEGPLQKNNEQTPDHNSQALVDGAKHALGKTYYDIVYTVLHNLRKNIFLVE